MNCLSCNVEYIPNSKAQKFCTTKCRYTYWKKKQPNFYPPTTEKITIKCQDCKIVKNKEEFNKNRSVKNGYDTRCKHCSSIRNRRLVNSPKHKYYIYRNNAKKRGYVFNLTYSDFISLWQKNCFYCNEKIETIGIDRKNNKIGYEKENIVPCCWKCNQMKGRSNSDDFLLHIKKINNYRE